MKEKNAFTVESPKIFTERVSKLIESHYAFTSEQVVYFPSGHIVGEKHSDFVYIFDKGHMFSQRLLWEFLENNECNCWVTNRVNPMTMENELCLICASNLSI